MPSSEPHFHSQGQWLHDIGESELASRMPSSEPRFHGQGQWLDDGKSELASCVPLSEPRFRGQCHGMVLCYVERVLELLLRCCRSMQRSCSAYALLQP